mgnify:CR=1 FL=1
MPKVLRRIQKRKKANKKNNNKQQKPQASQQQKPAQQASQDPLLNATFRNMMLMRAGLINPGFFPQQHGNLKIDEERNKGQFLEQAKFNYELALKGLEKRNEELKSQKDEFEKKVKEAKRQEEMMKAKVDLAQEELNERVQVKQIIKKLRMKENWLKQQISQNEGNAEIILPLQQQLEELEYHNNKLQKIHSQLQTEAKTKTLYNKIQDEKSKRDELIAQNKQLQSTIENYSQLNANKKLEEIYLEKGKQQALNEILKAQWEKRQETEKIRRENLEQEARMKYSRNYIAQLDYELNKLGGIQAKLENERYYNDRILENYKNKEDLIRKREEELLSSKYANNVTEQRIRMLQNKNREAQERIDFLNRSIAQNEARTKDNEQILKTMEEDQKAQTKKAQTNAKRKYMKSPEHEQNQKEKERIAQNTAIAEQQRKDDENIMEAQAKEDEAKNKLHTTKHVMNFMDNDQKHRELEDQLHQKEIEMAVLEQKNKDINEFRQERDNLQEQIDHLRTQIEANRSGDRPQLNRLREAKHVIDTESSLYEQTQALWVSFDRLLNKFRQFRHDFESIPENADLRDARNVSNNPDVPRSWIDAFQEYVDYRIALEKKDKEKQNQQRRTGKIKGRDMYTSTSSSSSILTGPSWNPEQTAKYIHHLEKKRERRREEEEEEEEAQQVPFEEEEEENDDDNAEVYYTKEQRIQAYNDCNRFLSSSSDSSINLPLASPDEVNQFNEAQHYQNDELGTNERFYMNDNNNNNNNNN